MINKKRDKLPTTEEFLQFKPKRLEFRWFIDKDGLVRIIVKKFESKIGKTLCKTVKKDNTFTANMDKIGSLIWKCCDGNTTVKKILEAVKNEFPKEEKLDQRLFLFIIQMKNLGYLNY
jgi:hypothetical protein